MMDSPKAVELLATNSQPGRDYTRDGVESSTNPRLFSADCPKSQSLMPEIITNLHMHTTYSDGSGSHAEIAEAALGAGIDVAIVTDHNVWVHGPEGYLQRGSRRVLLLVGEEVHDRTRDPQKNHLLVIGAEREMTTYSVKPQVLIDQITRAGGLAFLAHPFDPAMPAFEEPDISWEDWEVRGYTGLELWNGFSELKSVARSRLEALYYAFFPQYMAQAPLPATLKRWDELLERGQKVVAVGGSDAHALHMHLGPLRRTVFPYQFHFRAINNHLMCDATLSGNLEADKKMILKALRGGHLFIGYDLAAPTQGFRFTAQCKDGVATMGDEMRIGSGATLQIRMPAIAECRLLCNGKLIRTWTDREICAYTANQPGAYRVECYRPFLGQQRGWIFSNPIYLRA